MKIPTIEELISETPSSEQSELTKLLNQPPPKQWLKEHPTATCKNEKGETVKVKYLPIEKVELLLSRIYTKWNVAVLDTKVLPNSASVTVRLYVTNPETNEEEWNDGVGAMQNEKGTTVNMALPAAKSYATKDAAELFGAIFGKNLNRFESIVSGSAQSTRIENNFKAVDLKRLNMAIKKCGNTQDLQELQAKHPDTDWSTTDFEKRKLELKGKKKVTKLEPLL